MIKIKENDVIEYDGKLFKWNDIKEDYYNEEESTIDIFKQEYGLCIIDPTAVCIKVTSLTEAMEKENDKETKELHQ